MEIDKLQLVHIAQWLEDAARTIEKWAEHAPSYFKTKGRLLVDVNRFDERADFVRELLQAAKGIDSAAAPAAPKYTPEEKNVNESEPENEAADT